MVDYDLVAALRDYASWDQFRGGCQGCAMEEAADEIERLRVVAKNNNQLARMNSQHRDEWRTKAVSYAEALEAFTLVSNDDERREAFNHAVAVLSRNSDSTS